MAKLVFQLAPSGEAANQALQEWLAGGSAMLSADQDRLDSLFTVTRFRLAHGSLIAPSQVGTPMDDTKIATLTSVVLAAQEALRDLSVKAAAHAGASPVELTVRLASTQQKFSEALARVAQEIPEVAQAQEEPAPKTAAEIAATAALRFRLAKSLQKLEVVAGRIGELEAKPRFNAVRARLDTGRLASRVASLSASQAVTEDSVAELVASTDRLYGLFFPEG